ncbi:MAG: sugar ABC transporter ATP-binding protein [Mesorhizobium sp.]|nr:sugar ABC transporter ATP-binding protein [Mesorhizobium sp.]MBL8577604.1 sugar ABC transporter ATP-binding protein [Mesorhizobium sp.]
MKPPSPLLSVERVSLSYGRFKAVREASFSLGAGEVLGLCGHNGAGKSSIVRMLSGLLRPDSGQIVLDGAPCAFRSVSDAQRQGVALVDQELSVIPALTVAENLALGEPGLGLRGTLPREEARRRLDAVGLDHLDPSRPLEDLSIGERQLVEIARAIGRDARLFILDEPTATLNTADIEHVFKAVRRIAAAGCGVIYVSHRLDEVLALCQQIVVMRDGAVIAEQRAEDLNAAKLVELMIGHAPKPVTKTARTADDGSRILEVSGLSTEPTVDDFNLAVRPGTVTAIAGQVGSGGSDVLRALAGLAPTAQGDVMVQGRRVPLGAPRRSISAGIGFLSADRKGEGLFLSRSISENLLATRLRALSPHAVLQGSRMRATARKIASRIGIDQNRLGEPVRRLSGGNQQKTFLGRCMERDDISVLMLDEPTRGVDVGGRADIHMLLRELASQGVAVIFASSDLEEVLSLADDVVVMRAGRIVSNVPVAETDNVRLLSDMTHARLSEQVA